MATVHSTVKARARRNPPRKRPGASKSATRSKVPVKRHQSQSARVPSPHAKGPDRPVGPGAASADRGARVRVRGRLREMIQAETLNLCRAESVLRCLVLAMDYEPSDPQSPYYPDVVQVVGDLIKRSLVDLDALHSGYIPDPLMAAHKVER
jgi:hypothetical protein